MKSLLKSWLCVCACVCSAWDLSNCSGYICHTVLDMYIWTHFAIQACAHARICNTLVHLLDSFVWDFLKKDLLCTYVECSIRLVHTCINNSNVGLMLGIPLCCLTDALVCHDPQHTVFGGVSVYLFWPHLVSPTPTSNIKCMYNVTDRYSYVSTVCSWILQFEIFRV